MIFFVGKGTPGACGSGCSEWIAAEGAIDPGAARRFRDFLGALSRRDLPIFFNSSGGIVRQALALGTIMREHRMSARVGRTLPEGCRQTGATDECRRVMQSKSEHRARLITVGAGCLSSCVYALIGGSVRRVARGAQLGIHSTSNIAVPGRTPTRPPPTANEIDLLLKRYIVEMGVDPGLIDAAAEVGTGRVRYMTRDEIARFGIETLGFYETPWMLDEDLSKQIFLLKSVTQANRVATNEYRTGNVRLWCVGAGFGIWFVYRRELTSNEIGVATTLRVVAGDREFVMGGGARNATDERSARTDWEFLQDAVAVPDIVIIETLAPQGNAEGWSYEVKLSTKGLSPALAELRKSCGELTFFDAPAVKPLDVPGISHRQ
jgi:hypothetical protein